MPLPFDIASARARRAPRSFFLLLAVGGAAAWSAASCGLPGATSSEGTGGGAASTGTRSTGPSSGGSGQGGRAGTGSSATTGGANGGGGASVSASATTGSGGNGGGSTTSESSSTGGPPPPVCGNHQVEAGEQCDDGNVQPGDRCSATCQIEHPDTCPGTAIPLAPGTFTITDDTTGSGDDITTAGGTGTMCPAGTYPGDDLIYAVTPTQSGMITAKLAASYGHHDLHVRAACPGTADLACAFDKDANKPDTVAFPATQGTVYFVIVDSWQNEAGPFTLTLAL